MSCVVLGCKSHSSRKHKNAGLITFHRFPQDDLLKKEWLTRIGRENWTPDKQRRICSVHFTSNSFIKSAAMKGRRLRYDAVPTLFIKQDSEDITDDDECMDNDGEGHSAIVEYRETVLKEHQYCAPSGPTLFIKQESEDKIICMDNDAERHSAIMENRETVLNEHQYCASVQERQEFLRTESKQVNQYKIKIKLLEKEIERVRRVSKHRFQKINTLTRMISRLKKRNEDLHTIINDKLTQIHLETENMKMPDKINNSDIMKRFLQKQAGESLSREYSKEVKEFAVTLNYLSPEAYIYVREKFYDTLPHPKTISKWYKCLDPRLKRQESTTNTTVSGWRQVPGDMLLEVGSASSKYIDLRK